MSNFFFFFKYRVRNPFTRNPKYRVILPNRTEISDPHVPIFFDTSTKSQSQIQQNTGPPTHPVLHFHSYSLPPREMRVLVKNLQKTAPFYCSSSKSQITKNQTTSLRFSRENLSPRKSRLSLPNSLSFSHTDIEIYTYVYICTYIGNGSEEAG